MPGLAAYHHWSILPPLPVSKMEIDNITSLGNESSKWLSPNSTWNMNGSEEDRNTPSWYSKESQSLKDLETNLHTIGLPIIIFVGMLGNFVSLSVFSSSHMRYQSSNVYLIFLNVVDIVFLLCLMVIWLAWIQVNFIHNNGWCQLTIYLTYVSSFLSVWAVVSFSMERFIVVFFPLKRQSWCTRHRAMKVVAGLVVFSILMYSFALWTSGIDVAQGGLGSMCRWLYQYNHVMTVMIPLDSVITFVIPSTAIAILNISITVRIWRFIMSRQGKFNICKQCGRYVQDPWGSRNSSFFRRFSRWRRGNSSSDPSDSSPKGSKRCCRSARNSSINTGRQATHQLRTTRTLLMLSTVFVLLHTPSHAFRFYIILHQLHSTNIQTTRAMKLSQNITQILYYANFASNFFLYCSFSKMFRDSLARTAMRCKRCIQRRIQHLFGSPEREIEVCS